VAGEYDGDLVAGARRPPDRGRLAALQDGVVVDERAEHERCLAARCSRKCCEGDEDEEEESCPGAHGFRML